MMTGNEIRARFLKYFEERGHRVVASSPLIPHNDPTLLFINAGMNQFKDLFLGLEKRDYVRATTAQKCVRAGGKHNDLENVGRTARHHTFFEMLGNFSFGDYFKEDAIRFGWDFLTKEMNLPIEKLWVSVFRDDDEAFAIWRDQVGVAEDRILRMGEKDNFWAMGDTGPCGPCSEIHIDQGEEMSCGPDCGLGKCDCDRYLELWNLVFMQYERSEDGELSPLPKPSIDTGMGLERITAVVQGVQSNYDCDLLRGIIAHVEELSKKTYGANEENDVSMRVIADHSRAMAFLISDGVLPSNEGRGYVLRRIMRRAARHAKMLGFDDPVLYKTASFVIQGMAEAYSEMAERTSYVAKVVKNEEERFIQTLGNGLRILTDEVNALKAQGKTVIPGDVVFRLYDTYGFPVDLTADIVEKDNFTLDEEGFEACMEEQREKARQNWKGSGEAAVASLYHQLVDEGLSCEFTGYDTATGSGTLLAIIKNGERVSEAREGDRVELILSSTPFYGESGGQVGDQGKICANGTAVHVRDTQKPLPNLLVHHGKVLAGSLKEGDRLDLAVDTALRTATALNHTATHILQATLVEVLGDHVKQAGSLVTPDRLRFDFTHFSAMTAEEIAQVERKVNERIRQNNSLDTRLMSTDDAVAQGATALFGEKYGEEVRVVRLGEFSMELCGGTHAEAAGNIGLFKILQETGIAAGVRRIEAVTGEKALEAVKQQEELIDQVAALLKTDRSHLETRLAKLLEHQKELEKEVETLRDRLNADKAGSLVSQAREIDGVKVLVTKLDNTDGKKMREMADQLRDQLGSGLIVLGSECAGKANLLVAVTKDLTKRFHAGNLVKILAEKVGGKGGGRPDLAQAGGSQPEMLTETLKSVETLITSSNND